MVASVNWADKVLVIDGCPVTCAKLTMDEAGLNGYDYVVVTNLGIEKNHEFALSECDIKRVLDACRNQLKTSE